MGVGSVALAAELLLIALGSASGDAGHALVTAIAFTAALATMLAGLSRPSGSRAPWLVLGLGMAGYGGAFLVLYFHLGSLTSFPSLADFLWLAFYPLTLAALALLARDQRRSDRLGISLDAAIIALAIGALGYELIFNGLIDVGRASEVVGGQLSYSMLDLAIVVMLVLVCAPSRSLMGRAYVAFGAGMLVLMAGDVLVVKQYSEGTYVPGTLLDATWPAGLLLLAGAARFDTSLERVTALRGRALYAAITLSFIATFALLIHEAISDRNTIVMVLAAIVPCLVVIRFVASARENERLARDNDDIISAAGEGIFRTDLTGRITFANPVALEMLGYSSEEEMLGTPAHHLVHHPLPDGGRYPAASCPVRDVIANGSTHRVTDELFRRRDGRPLPVDYTTSPLREGGRVVGAVTVFDDVTYQREMKEKLRHQADHDSLTGLYNRRRFEEEVADQLSYARRYSRPGALLLMDLDSFKFVNDSYGHPAGDGLLFDVGSILAANVRETDVVARIGGDEFAVLLREANPAEAVGVARALIAAIRSGSKPSVGASFGIAPFDAVDEQTPDELLIAADVALYTAKEAGGGTAELYAGQNNQTLTWVEQIRDALDEDRIVVYSQPIVELATGRVAREELLVRMVGGDGDMVPPAEFLPAAERFGLINEIDLRVLSRAVELVAAGISVSVNVSARTLTDCRYLDLLERAVAGGADPRQFTFEITETAAVANMVEAQEFARRIGELGCSLALDDFGTGFSSFAYLKHIPARYLKIDIEFIRELKRNSADRQMVEAIVSVAHGLGRKTIAEGIEDAATLAVACELGVDYGQGFHLGRPMPAFGLPGKTGHAGRAPSSETCIEALNTPPTRS